MLCFINPLCTCAARVTIVVLCVYECVSIICHHTQWNHKREVPMVRCNTRTILIRADLALFKS